MVRNVCLVNSFQFIQQNKFHSMEKYLKLERLDTPPNTPLSSKNFNHWFRSFSSFLCKIIEPNVHTDLDKLDTLINCISSDVYEYIAECNTFDNAVNRLKELYIKPPNEVFARHLLATCGQKRGGKYWRIRTKTTVSLISELLLAGQHLVTPKETVWTVS